MNLYIMTPTICAFVKKNNQTQIIEDINRKLVNLSLKNIIESNCLFYGSSYKGRKEASNNILISKYKNPIIIDEKNEIVLFETESIKNPECIYLNFKKIKNIESKHNLTYIKLVNNTEVITKTSKYVIINQLLKCQYLLNILNQRKQ